MKRVVINQEDNFSGKFGEVLRSSAIFWVKNNESFKSTINFMNYWKLKRTLEVALVGSLRDMSGKLIHRFRINMDLANVFNLNKFPDNFEGSLELEVFSNENMVIPYSAIMVIYESLGGISMVHGYTRTYSLHEVEEQRTICEGEEGDWQIRDNNEIRSLAIVHNGFQELINQTWILNVTNAYGLQIKQEIVIPLINPYETIKIYPSEHIKNLVEFLGNKKGNATLSFYLGNAFSRMLLCHEKNGDKDFQVTHSNFNYSKHQTNILDNHKAYMFVPSIKNVNLSTVIYPDAEPGSYNINGKKSYEFNSGESLTIDNEESTWLEFSRVDGKLPSRIVTAIEGNIKNSNMLPFECSLGVMTNKRPPKRMWWGTCYVGEKFESMLIVLPMDRIYGDLPKNLKINIRLYNSENLDIREQTIDSDLLSDLATGINFNIIFPEIDDSFKSNFCYFTLYSEYGGFWVYSTLKNSHESLTIEHAF